MTVIGEAFLAIRPQVTQAGFEQELNKSVQPAGVRVAKTLATAIGGAFVVSKIKAFAQAGIDELKEAAAVQAQTAAAIRSTGGAANVTDEQVASLAGSLLKVSGVDDELIQKGENLLLTFTNVRNETGKGNDVFNQATKASLDLSRAGFGSVESAAVLLGKALNDPVQGVTALQRVGVRLSDSQKDLIKNLVATGDTLGAQKVILEEVNRQVGGSAEAYGKTLPGQLAIAQESLTNTKAVMVAGMAPALQLTAKLTQSATEQFAKQPLVLQQIEGGLLLTVGALGAVITPLKSAVDLWRSFATGASAAADASKVMASGTDAVRTGTQAAAVATGQLAGQTTAVTFAVDAASEAVGGLAADAIHLATETGTLTVAQRTAAAAIADEAAAAALLEGSTASAALSTGQLALFTGDLSAVTPAAAREMHQLSLFTGEAAASMGTLDAAQRATAASQSSLMATTRSVNLAKLGTDAQNSAASVATLYQNSSRLGTGLGTVKGAALGLGIQLGVLYGVMQLLGKSAEHVDLGELQADLLDLSKTAKDVDLAGISVDRLNQAIERVTAPSALSQVENFSGVWQRALGDTDDKLSTARARVDDVDKALAALAQQDPDAASLALRNLQNSLSPENADRLLTLLDDYDAAVHQAGVSSRLAGDDISQVGHTAATTAPDVAALAGATDGLAGATDDYAGSAEEGARQTQVWRDKMAAAQTAVDDLFGSVSSAATANLDYLDSVDSTSDALTTLSDLQKDGKAGTDEYRRAIDDTARAMIEQSQSAADNAAEQFKLAGVTLDAGQKATIQRDELIKLRDTLGPNDPLRKNLQGMIDQLGDVVSKQVTVDVLTGAAEVALDRLARRLNELPGDLRISVGGGGGLTLSAGGRVPQYLAAGGIGGPRGTDIIPAWLTPGEGVLNAAAMAKLPPGAFDALNRGSLPSGGPSLALTFEAGAVVLGDVKDPNQAAALGRAFGDGAGERIMELWLATQARAQG